MAFHQQYVDIEQPTVGHLSLEQIEMLLNQLSEAPDATVREHCQEMRGEYFP